MSDLTVQEIARWLRHIDRLDEISGAHYPGLVKNPLWDASMALEERFGSDTEVEGKQFAAEARAEAAEAQAARYREAIERHKRNGAGAGFPPYTKRDRDLYADARLALDQPTDTDAK